MLLGATEWRVLSGTFCFTALLSAVTVASNAVFSGSCNFYDWLSVLLVGRIQLV